MHADEKTGIYIITCEANDTRYIGSAIRLKDRWVKHRREARQNKHHSSRLQNTWNKYGEASFKFEIVEECTREQLVIREQYWMDKLNPELNMNAKAGSRLGTRHSPEAKEKMRLAKLGKKQTPEHIAAAAITRIGNKFAVGNKGKKRSPDAVKLGWITRRQRQLDRQKELQYNIV